MVTVHRYRMFNAAMATTAVTASVATGTAIKTMLQLATPATRQAVIVSWGYSLSVAPGAASTVELIQTDVAATVTAHGASGVQPLDPNAPASLMTLGTSATGFTASAEGTPTATRVFDARVIPLAAGATDLTYEKVFTAGERSILAVSKFLRVRVITPTSGANMLTWICWDE